MITTLVILTALVLGAAWRRWWGDIAATWWPWKRLNGDGIGYRATQAIVGFAVLFGLCLLLDHSWWSAAFRSAFALAFLTSMAESIPHIWRGWEWIDTNIVSLKSRYRIINGYTTYAEMSAGALVWMIAATS